VLIIWERKNQACQDVQNIQKYIFRHFFSKCRHILPPKYRIFPSEFLIFDFISRLSQTVFLKGFFAFDFALVGCASCRAPIFRSKLYYAHFPPGLGFKKTRQSAGGVFAPIFTSAHPHHITGAAILRDAAARTH
jgi:hypothetical protein